MDDHKRLYFCPEPTPEELERAYFRARKLRSEAAVAGINWITATIRSAFVHLFGALMGHRGAQQGADAPSPAMHLTNPASSSAVAGPATGHTATPVTREAA